MNHRDAGATRIDRSARSVGDAVDTHVACIGRQGAREHRHQRALSGAVFTDERADFARSDRQIHTVERDRRAKRSPNAAHLQGSGHLFSHFERSGCRRAEMSGWLMLSCVARTAPVSMTGSTCSPTR